MRPEWVAARQPARRENRPPDDAVPDDRLRRVVRAGRQEPAGPRVQGGNQNFVESKQSERPTLCDREFNG